MRKAYDMSAPYQCVQCGCDQDPAGPADACPSCGHQPPAAAAAARRRIFLSYGRDEYAPFASQLSQDLKARGHGVWIDQEHLAAGRDWEQRLEAGLNWVSEHPGEGRMLLVMTPHSVRRPDSGRATSQQECGYCLNELTRAFRRGLPVVPVMLVWVEPPLSIDHLQYLDMKDCAPLPPPPAHYEAGLARLAQALEHNQLDFQGVQARLLARLQPISFNAEMQHYVDGFTGRRWVFDRFDAWLRDPAAPRVLWLVGPPGSGKTAIALWLCQQRREVAAFHLCRHGDTIKADPRRCVLSIAYQLASQLPDYQDRLNAADLEGLAEANAATLFDALVIQQLSGGFPRPDRLVVVVIDALDEATQGGRNELAEFIGAQFDRSPDWLRLFVTSRPEAEVELPLRRYARWVLDTAGRENEADLREYLDRELAGLAGGQPPAPEVIDTIITRSEGLFLYAHWVVSELAQGRLSLDRVGDFPQGMGEAYHRFFRRQFADEKAYEADILLALEVLAAARQPLSLDELGRILDWQKRRVWQFCRAVGSLFRISEQEVQPFHRGVMEWLADPDKAGPYWVDGAAGHRRLADYGWREYTGGEGGDEEMSAYTCCHLPFHLAAAGRWQDLTTVIQDCDFHAASGQPSYSRWYRFELPEWKSLLADWLTHLLRSRQPARALTAAATMYFNGFWWWGDYVPYPLCRAVLDLLRRHGRSPAAGRLCRLLAAFDEAYPPGSEYTRRAADPARWATVRTALLGLQEVLDCGGDPETLRDDPVRLHLRVLTDVYLGDALRYLGEPAARSCYQGARALLPDLENDAWFAGWILALEAETLAERGQPEQAIATCRQAWQAAVETENDAEEGEGGSADCEDKELRATLLRVLADAAQAQADWPRAWLSAGLSLLYALWFQAVPHEADAYTIAFYEEQLARTAQRLLDHHAADQKAAAAAAKTLWETLRELAPDTPAWPEATVRAALAGRDAAGLATALFPPPPGSGDAQLACRIVEVMAGRQAKLAKCRRSLGID